MNLPALNYLRNAKIGLFMFAFGILFAYVIFPPILKFILRSVSNKIFLIM